MSPGVSRLRSTLIELSSTSIGRPPFGLIILVVLLLIPATTTNPYVIFITTAALFAGMVALGLNVVVGLSGIWQLAQAAFLAVGGYTAGFLAKYLGISLWLGIPAGGLVAAALSLLLALPTVRLRDEYLMIATLNFGVIAQIVMMNLDWLTGGTAGMSAIPPIIIPWWSSHGLILTGAIRPDQQYYVVLIGFVVTWLIVRRLQASPIGRALRAMRDDEIVAQTMGQNTLHLRLIAFAIGCGLAGIAGGVFVARFLSISPDAAVISNSVLYLSMVVVGGTGNPVGVVLGAALLSTLPELLRDLDKYRLLAYGVILVVTMIFRPQGLFPERMQSYVAGRDLAIPGEKERLRGSS
jgi:branched-chain amino acid transport system permease protein